MDVIHAMDDHQLFASMNNMESNAHHAMNNQVCGHSLSLSLSLCPFLFLAFYVCVSLSLCLSPYVTCLCSGCAVTTTAAGYSHGDDADSRRRRVPP